MDLSVLVVGVVGLVALVTKITDFLRLLANLSQQRSAVLTQAVAWVGGVAGVFLYSASDFGPTVKIGTLLLDDVNSFSKVVLGLAVASAGSLAVDFKQALDRSDSAAKPPLVPGPSGVPVQPSP
jgi:hypothetical protein